MVVTHINPQSVVIGAEGAQSYLLRCRATCYDPLVEIGVEMAADFVRLIVVVEGAERLVLVDYGFNFPIDRSGELHSGAVQHTAPEAYLRQVFAEPPTVLC